MEYEKGLQIVTLDDAIHVQKITGTEVYYYLFPEYEIHINRIAAHSIQEWHYHQEIEEVLVITKGELLCRWLENEEEKEQILHEKQLVRVGNAVHTFENQTNADVEFIVFRLVLDGEEKQEKIKRDKVAVER